MTRVVWKREVPILHEQALWICKCGQKYYAYKVEEPRLTEVWTKIFLEFKGSRELYQKSIPKTNTDPNTSVICISFQTFIDDTNS